MAGSRQVLRNTALGANIKVFLSIIWDVETKIERVFRCYYLRIPIFEK